MDGLELERYSGAITRSQPLCLAVELASDGNLLGLFRRNRPDAEGDDPSLSLSQLYSFAWQIADGMEFIVSRGFIHRDVAARNVLICDGLTAKVQ